MIQMKDDFSKRLNFVMKEKNISIRDISDATNTSYEMVRRYAKGIAKPRDTKLESLCKFLGVNRSWLKFGDKRNEQYSSANRQKSDNSYCINSLNITENTGNGYSNSDVQERH